MSGSELYFWAVGVAMGVLLTLLIYWVLEIIWTMYKKNKVPGGYNA